MEYIGTTKTGERVVDRSDGSHIHKTVQPFLAEAISKIEIKVDPIGRRIVGGCCIVREIDEKSLILSVDMSHVIGGNTCVETGQGDEIIFAQRPNRAGLTRFVRNRQAEPCSIVTLILKQKEEVAEEEYVLLTAFIGPPAELEPRHPNATEISKKFWNTHALVWGSEEIIPETETQICPW